MQAWSSYYWIEYCIAKTKLYLFKRLEIILKSTETWQSPGQDAEPENDSVEAENTT